MRKFMKFFIAVLVILAVAVGVVGCTQLSKDSKVTNPAALTQGLSTDKGLSLNNAVSSPSASEVENMQVVNEQIVTDLKSNISNMFKAWKAGDMEEFRKYTSLAYTGSLLDSKATEAEEFILEAQGADIVSTNYKNVKVLKAEAGIAVVECQFDYNGYEYNPVTEVRGERIETVLVNKEYTLEFKDNHWYIAGEKEKGQN